MKRSTARVLLVICTILVVIILCCMIPSGEEWGMIILLIFLPIAIVLKYFQRCRHCGRWPRKGDSWFDTYCPRCGEPLDDE